MKVHARQPHWPAPSRTPAAKTEAEKPPDLEKRLKLALLDQYAVANEQRGYNPYDTTPSGKPDVWHRKPKRG